MKSKWTEEELHNLATVLVFIAPRDPDGDPLWYLLTGKRPWSPHQWEVSIRQWRQRDSTSGELSSWALYRWLTAQRIELEGTMLATLEDTVARILKLHNMQSTYDVEISPRGFS